MEASIRAWLRRVNLCEKIPDAVVALHFGIQRVYGGYEVYLSGHADYDNADDWWLLAECYAPRENYVSLGEESLRLDEHQMLRKYKEVLLSELDARHVDVPGHIVAVTLGYPAGIPERIR